MYAVPRHSGNSLPESGPATMATTATARPGVDERCAATGDGNGDARAKSALGDGRTWVDRAVELVVLVDDSQGEVTLALTSHCWGSARTR